MSLCQKISHLLTRSKDGQKRFLMFLLLKLCGILDLSNLSFFFDKGPKQKVDMELGSINKCFHQKSYIHTVLKVDGDRHSQKVAICKGPW